MNGVVTSNLSRRPPSSQIGNSRLPTRARRHRNGSAHSLLNLGLREETFLLQENGTPPTTCLPSVGRLRLGYLETNMKIAWVLLLTLVCFGCGGYGSSSTPTKPQPGVVPVIAELSPDNTNAGGPAFILTVNGSSFASGSIVKWNGTNLTTTFVTAKQLTADIPATAIATSGTVPVTVTNPAVAGTGGPYGSGGTMAATSVAMNFTVE